MKCVEMAHGLNPVLKRSIVQVQPKPEGSKTGIGSRRIFSPQFKLQVLDSYRNDADCKGNQRATARKYGIHRRQIQKWLQAETALRNGVSGKQQQHIIISANNGVDYNHQAASLNAHRQRDDDVASANRAQQAEARVPALEPPSGWQANQVNPVNQAPLDFTTHTRSSPPASSYPTDPAAPIDLSFKSRTSLTAPVLMLATRAPLTVTPPLSVSPNSLPSQPDVWDLSTKGLKRKLEDRSGQTSPKPVKLFKPYLDDLKDNDVDTSYASSTSSEPTVINNVSPPPLKYENLESPPQNIYCCQSSITCSPDVYYLNNNNNLCCDVKPEPYPPGYTLHELQPKSYYSAFYPYSPSDYELSPTYCPYDDPLYPASLKQRQSYSLDFKLRAIDSYYQDSICKGNQRAVASKYNIHRRQVQKWLKQEDELKARQQQTQVMSRFYKRKENTKARKKLDEENLKGAKTLRREKPLKAAERNHEVDPNASMTS